MSTTRRSAISAAVSNHVEQLLRSRRCFIPPRPDIHAAERDAEKICRNESQLRCLDSNDAHDDAVQRRQKPALPMMAANENG